MLSLIHVLWTINVCDLSGSKTTDSTVEGMKSLIYQENDWVS